MLQNKKLEAITKDDLQALIDHEVKEGVHIDYKESIAAAGDRKSLSTDVAALANARGGDIVFGIREKRDADGKPTGVPEALAPLVINFDHERIRLSQMIEAGLDPTVLPKVQFHEVIVEDGCVVILRVGKSWAAPHMVKDGWKFPMRHDGHNLPMDSGTLRSAFAASRGWGEQAQGFRDKRISRLVSGENDLLNRQPCFVLHLVPFSVASIDALVDLDAIKRQSPHNLGDTGGSFRFNVDGLLKTTGSRSYTQFFRDGSVEAALAVEKLYPHHIDMHVVSALPNLARAVLDAGATGPCFVSVTLAGMNGLVPQLSQEVSLSYQLEPFDRPIVFLQEVVSDDFGAGLAAALKPIFDHLAQACGLPRSLAYDEGGNYLAPGDR